MAVTVSRRAGSGSANFTQGLQRADSITYTVVGYDVRELKRLMSNGTRPIDLQDIPNYGQVHPENPSSGMTARTFAVSESETGYAADVVVGFSTSNVTGTGRLFAVPDLTDNKYVWDLTFTDVEIELPTAYRVEGVVGDGASEQTVRHWEVRPNPVAESHAVIQARWQIGPQSGNAFSPALRLAFENEHNLVHTIGGNLYLFRVLSISARDNDTYDIVCSWTRDDGTPVIDGYTDGGELYRTVGMDMPWLAGHEPPAGLIRRPFHHLETTVGEEPGSDDADLSVPRGVQFRDRNPGDIGNVPYLPFTP